MLVRESNSVAHAADASLPSSWGTDRNCCTRATHTGLYTTSNGCMRSTSVASVPSMAAVSSVVSQCKSAPPFG